MESKKPTRKPAAKPSPKPKPSKPGDGLLGWFGRQVGHVKNAVKADVPKPGETKTPAAGKSPPGKSPTGKPAAGKTGASKSGPSKTRSTGKQSAAAPHQNASAETVIYREDTVELAELPDRPGMMLRRTIIDEVVVETQGRTQPPAKSPH